ncbi:MULTISPECIES: Rv3235 family protein [unclassified Streptomyces]|uniref:Rv3235 family protein n=1 Tax=unclassified Streptomyces TaxID=2593676 RepID=UPI00224FCFED|nr:MULTISPECIES: Rv3235 family protein [unclassified Streptomyces]MCX5287774.1 Rv3235 family protein [Streptomyces sp. NBC_00183]
MHKVMTRAQHQPGTRPPGRRDSRRPGGAPPRIPGGTATSTAPGGGRPPGSRAGGHSPGTRPDDNRPPTAHAGPASGATAARTRPATPPKTTAPSATGPCASTSMAPACRTTTHAPPDVVPTPGEAASAAPVTGITAGHPRPAPRPRPTDVFADLLLAVLSGQRPVHSMLRHTAGRAYDELAWLAERGPLRTRGTRPVVRDIGYYEARPGAVEAFARVGAGDQLRAMAFRLERGQDLRWRCTAVELGGPRPPRPTDD